MKAAVVALGRQIVEAERRKDALFAEQEASTASLSQQIQQYVTLRGCDHAGHAARDGH